MKDVETRAKLWSALTGSVIIFNGTNSVVSQNFKPHRMQHFSLLKILFFFETIPAESGQTRRRSMGMCWPPANQWKMKADFFNIGE